MTQSERGVALVVTLLIMTVITAIGLGCVLMARAETRLGSSFENSAALIYAADAGIAKVESVLCRTPTPLVSPLEAFDDHRWRVVLGDASVVDLASETAARQRETDAIYGTVAANPDAPQWQLVAHAPLADLIPGGIVRPTSYVAVWRADDAEDGDGDPAADKNGRVQLLAAAFGARHGLRVVQVSVECVPGTGRVRLSDWRIVR